MKHKESFSGSKNDFSVFIKKAMPDIFSNKFLVEGKKVNIPSDYQLDYDVKYDDEETGGSLAIKVSWDTTNIVEEEEEL